MASILIVDDDKNFLLSLADGLKAFEKKFNVLTAENGQDAVDLMRTQKIDLMITDLKMPVMDGFELLAHMVPNYPHIPVIVMTAFATREMEENLVNMGTFQFLEKPLDFNVLVEKIQEGLEVRSHYFTKVLSLHSFLRMVEMEARTCTIAIRSQDKLGYLYFLDGVLIDGEAGTLKGEEAVREIIQWQAAEVELDGHCNEENRKIDKPLNFIIKEAVDRITKATRSETEAKENTMNIAKLERAMDILKEDLENGLLGSGIVDRVSRRTIVDFNSNPRAGVLFSQITKYLIKILEDCNMPPLGKYYLVHLADDSMIVAIPLGDYEWRIIIDLKKVTLGMLLNVTLPKIIDAFMAAAG
ncbi:MAG: response regulator [bacterium]|nr:response regulator [bacterium]